MIKVISFDLDNTLYDNAPVIQLAEQKSYFYLEEEFRKQKLQFDYQLFNDYRLQMIQSENEISSDKVKKFDNLSYLRYQALKKFCLPLENQLYIVEQAFEIFMMHRNLVFIEKPISQLLDQLKTNYFLASVTNGNCDVRRLSIGHYFEKNYSPTSGFHAKPHPEMLKQICSDFEIGPDQLTHVGDSLKTDGQAAANAQCNFFHFSPFEAGRTISGECNKFLQQH